MSARPSLVVLLVLLLAAPAAAAPPRALFDNTHAETAGNADWIIDTDQPVPLPDQSTFTAATPRTTWLGAISSWGVDLVKRGYQVATLTATYGITYGNAANPYDLSQWDVFIVPEPNTVFTRAESTAVFEFVRHGGGLVMVVDHYISDRNNDGWDSPEIYNALDAQLLWGIHAGVAGDANTNIVQTSTNVNPSASDSITHGPEGTVTGLAFHNGTTFTLHPEQNPTVRGEVWMNGVPQSSTAGLMAASAVWGDGRIVIVGDSSPADDGSAQGGNSNIYDGWGEAGATDSTFFMNATRWATRRQPPADAAAPVVQVLSPAGGEHWTAASAQWIAWSASDDVGVDSVRVEYSTHGAAGPWTTLASGLAGADSLAWTVPGEVTDSALVRVTAWDAALHAATASSDSLFHIVAPLAAADVAPALAFARPAPNPSRGLTRFAFALPSPTAITLEVLDVSGRRVATLARGTFGAGPHAVAWDGRDPAHARVPAGVYFARLVTPTATRTRRFVRIE